MNSGTFDFGKYSLPLSSKTYIMGILNITPDSFSDGGKYVSSENAVKHAYDMALQGADIIDIGGQSTRPGSSPISWQTEWERISAPLAEIIKNIPEIPVSVDTFYPEVALRSLDMGASIINDISGCGNDSMLKTVKEYNAGIVIMHPGNPDMINGEICYKNGVVSSVSNFFDEALEKAANIGLNRNHICLDPGIGFGKTMDECFELIRNTSVLKKDNTAYLIGASRKRITAQGNVPFEDRLAGTLAIHTAAQLYGADILRVHDVKEAVQATQVIDKLIRGNSNG